MNLLHKSVKYAEELRERATPAERELCSLLDAQKISYVFQSNMVDFASRVCYIADFRIRRVPPVRPKGMPRKKWTRDNRKLFIEVDGGYHEARKVYDARRTRWIVSHRDAVVLRFKNEEIFNRPEMVLAEIEKYNPARLKTRVSCTSPWR